MSALKDDTFDLIYWAADQAAIRNESKAEVFLSEEQMASIHEMKTGVNPLRPFQMMVGDVVVNVRLLENAPTSPLA